jgi:hypothetical protein
MLYSVTKRLEAKLSKVGEVLPEQKCRNNPIYELTASWCGDIYLRNYWEIFVDKAIIWAY